MNAPVFLSASQRQQFDADATRRRSNWLQSLNTLNAEVREWLSERPEWQVEATEVEVTEETLGGKYLAPALEITAPPGRVILEPIARAVLGAQGRVDLYAWPSLFRVMLLLQPDGNWVIRTDSGLNWPFPWKKSTFFDLAQQLIHAQ